MADQTYKVTWKQHSALIALLAEAPRWQQEAVTASLEALSPGTGFGELVQAFMKLDYGNQLHLGYALNHRGGTGARILAEQHGGKPEFRNYVHVCELLGVQLPEGF
jgi:hypothetical protein